MRRRLVSSGVLVLAVSLLSSPLARCQSTQRVTVAEAGRRANDKCFNPVITPDGRFVAFGLDRDELVPGDTNDSMDVFVRDRRTGVTELVSVSTTGAQGDFHSREVSISPDARFVAFVSGATNLVADDTNHWEDVFVRDRLAGTTVRVSVSSSGREGHDAVYGAPSISADGRLRRVRERRGRSRSRGLERLLRRVRPRPRDLDDRASQRPRGGGQGNFMSYAAVDLGRRPPRRLLELRIEPRPGDTNGNPDIFLRDWRLGGRSGSASVPAVSRRTA
jgi:hypothetical protein